MSELTINHPESLGANNRIAVVTSTFYPTWTDIQSTSGSPSTDQVRGVLALQTIQAAIEQGFQISVVDAGSSPEFKDRLRALKAQVGFVEDKSMSEQRRQAIKTASGFEGCDVIAWIEPEKVSMITDCLSYAVRPILEGTADIVIPKRNEASLATYPEYQLEFERKGNREWNAIIKKYGLRGNDEEDLDVWFGPKFFKNTPDLVALFMEKYQFNPRDGSKLDQLVEPELWPNAVFLPVIAAINGGFKVASVDVPYSHPAEQVANEVDDKIFRRKRDVQRKSIILSTLHFVKLLKGTENSRLKKID